jgi:hypothetical protein
MLMLWQLFASAFAHPLELPQRFDQTLTHAASEPKPCHEHAMGMNGMDDMSTNATHTESSMHQDSCKSVCKCPCGGTPALSFSIAFVPTAYSNAGSTVALPEGIASQPPSKLLRPPI